MFKILKEPNDCGNIDWLDIHKLEDEKITKKYQKPIAVKVKTMKYDSNNTKTHHVLNPCFRQLRQDSRNIETYCGRFDAVSHGSEVIYSLYGTPGGHLSVFPTKHFEVPPGSSFEITPGVLPPEISTEILSRIPSEVFADIPSRFVSKIPWNTDYIGLAVAYKH